MSGVEAIGLALGCSTLAFGLVPSILDYRSLPEHCSELQDFINRQSTNLAIIEADFQALMDRELLSPGTLAMTEKEIESLSNLLHRYRKCLEDFRKMLTNIAKPKTTFFDFRRLQMVIKGKTGPGIGTLQSRQSLLQMYMIELEATGYRKFLERNRVTPSSFGSRLGKVQLGRIASAAYRVSPLQEDCFDLTDDTTPTRPSPNIDIIRPSSPTDTLVGTVGPEDADYLCIPTRDDAESFVTLQNSLSE